MHNTPELFFEYTMTLFFGNKADNCAGQERNEKHRKEWLQKTAKVIMNRVAKLDTTTRHLQILSANAEAFSKALKNHTLEPWNIIYILLRLCGVLLGFDCRKGYILHNLIYHQTRNQYYTNNHLEGGDPLQYYYDEKDAISIRKEIVKKLKDKGLRDFKIALILNTTEYQVKKLKKSP